MASAMELSHAPKSDEDQSWDPHFFTSNPTALAISPTVHTYFAVQQGSQPVDPDIAPWLSGQIDDAIPERALPPSHSKGKGSSFSLIKPKHSQSGSRARPGRTSESNIDAGSSISTIPTDDHSKMSFFKALKRKVSQTRIQKDPSFSDETPPPPVPSLPPGSNRIPPPTLSPSNTRPSRTKFPRFVPRKPGSHAATRGSEEEIRLDTDMGNLAGVVANPGPSRPSFASGEGRSITTSPTDDVPPNDSFRLWGEPSLNGSTQFTNPFAGSPTSTTRRNCPEPLILNSSPTGRAQLNGINKPLPAQPPPTAPDESTHPNTAPWQPPESWAVERTDAHDAAEVSSVGDHESFHDVMDDSSMHEHLKGLHEVQRGTPIRSPSHAVVEYKTRIMMGGEPLFVKLPYGSSFESAKHRFVASGKSALKDLESFNNYRLWIRDRGRERTMGMSEKIVPLIRKRLLAYGYDAEQIPNAVTEDLSHIYRLTIREANYRPERDDFVVPINKAEFIDLTSQNLTKIPIALYKHAPDIVTLALSRNVGIDIPLDFIQSCESLRELKLAGVGMKRIPPAILQSHIHRLDISSNRITNETLVEAGLDQLTELRSLKMQNNRFSSLPEYFSRMDNLKYLNVSSNRFKDMPSILFQIPSLMDLDVSYNEIRTLPPAISRITNLQRLILTGNQLTTLPAELAQLTLLEHLDLSRNPINDVSITSSFPRLKELSAIHNAIQVVDLRINPFLQELSLSHNHITRLHVVPNPADSAAGLLKLDLSHAKLSTLDEAPLLYLTTLTTLKLDHNHFRSLPKSLCAIKALQVFTCSNNMLDALPEDIGMLENLRVLDVHSNNLQELPLSLWQCKSLEALNATSNLISFWYDPPTTQSHNLSVDGINGVDDGDRRPSAAPPAASSPGPSTGVKLPTRMGRQLPPLVRSLTKLYLSDNSLKDDCIHPISVFKHLRVLNLSFNDIQDLPTFFLNRLTHLEELYLSGNKLSALPPDDLQKLTKLHTLYLNGNKLQTLPSELNKVKSLQLLDVGSNQLRYNINNWEFDWNWNFNGNLQFLNLSGNKRLEIRPDFKQGHGRHEEANLHEFNGLKQLKVLGIMDVTTGFTSNVPDESEERRVRTSDSEVNGMSYGVADSIKRGGTLSMFDLVSPNFRFKESECLVGIFGRPEISHNNAKLSKFIHENFNHELIIQLNALRPEVDEGPVQALSRAFLSLNGQIWKYLSHSSYMGSGRKMSHVSVATNSGSLWTDWQALQAGSSAVVLYMSERTLYVANAGNSLAVLSRRGEAHLLSKRHDPSDQSERDRIRGAEGWVSSKGLLGEEVDVTRSLGMFHLAPSVIARPDVFEEELTSDDDYIILGNRYLWDYVPYQNAVDIVKHIGDPMIAAQKLRDCAMGYGATESVIVMVLRIADLFSPRKATKSKTEDDMDDGYYVRRRGEPGANKLLARLPGEVDAPVGTVALVFTDIRNSTALWEKNAGMSTAMRLHNEMLMRQLMNIGGYLVKTEGDAFMCSFPTATSALLWCFTVQLQLLKLEWPLEILESQDGREIWGPDGKPLARGLSVRMGIHWGSPLCEPDLVTHRMDYLGPVTNRAARISGSAQGGQIMISNDVIQELRKHFAMDEKEPPPTPPKDSELEDPEKRREQSHVEAIRRIGLVLTPMGEHKLKGIEAPEPLSLIWPSELTGRLHLRGDEGAEASKATADASSRVPFSITQMKELAMLCIRLETLTSGRVFKTAPARKTSAAVTTSAAALAASAAAAAAGAAATRQGPGTVGGTEAVLQQGREAGEVVERPMSTGSKSGGPLIMVEGEEEGAPSVYLLANPELLMPTIREGATDDELMLLLDSLSLRIQNAMAALYLERERERERGKQAEGYVF